MKTRKLLFVSITAILMVACDRSVESQTDTSSQKSIMENAADTASAMKDESAELVTTSKEVISEKSKSAAEIASTFVKEGSSQVVTLEEKTNEKITEVIDEVKGRVEDVKSLVPSENDSTNDALSHINGNK